jgi:hypothetical protein
MKTISRTAKKEKAWEARKGASWTYDAFKEFEGKRYTGMNKWLYDPGEWKETKVTPDLWEFNYAVTKRRSRKAPEGSGVPVGTEYHWYIAAHQNVKKLNANDYTTSMSGVKFKIAYKRADTEKWSAGERGRRNRLIRFLQELIRDLELQDIEEKEKESLPAAA